MPGWWGTLCPGSRGWLFSLCPGVRGQLGSLCLDCRAWPVALVKASWITALVGPCSGQWLGKANDHHCSGQRAPGDRERANDHHWQQLGLETDRSPLQSTFVVRGKTPSLAHTEEEPATGYPMEGVGLHSSLLDCSAATALRSPTFSLTSVPFLTASSRMIWKASCRNSSPAALSRAGWDRGSSAIVCRFPRSMPLYNHSGKKPPSVLLPVQSCENYAQITGAKYKGNDLLLTNHGTQQLLKDPLLFPGDFLFARHK